MRNAVAFSPDNTKVAVSDIGEVKLWDIRTQSSVLTLHGNTGLVFAVAFSPDGKKLAVAGSALKLWDVETGKALRTLADRDLRVTSVAFSPDGKSLATVAEDKTVKLWDVESGKNIDTFMGHRDGVLSIAFSPDGTTLASRSNDHTIKLWSVATGKHIYTLGRTASSSIATQIFWDVIAGISNIGGLTQPINSVAFSPDGTTLASGASDGTVKLWQVETGRNTTTLAAPGWYSKSVAFSPDGEIIACTSETLGTVKLWEVSTGKTVDTITGHTGSVDFAAFSPAGTILAASNRVGVKLWNVDTGRNSVPFTPTGGLVWCIFSRRYHTRGRGFKWGYRTPGRVKRRENGCASWTQ
ncbi:MAG: WD40 repeat domain-containing protein [Candidatus Poribacteria bacterium]|nr:WD40 repeat domain-containing protein [Candidatus Poribacteria bacterium]MDE0505852.1 WD40 repeat domain-containing protein [Candidatus Poribacteria bacterium]